MFEVGKDVFSDIDSVYQTKFSSYIPPHLSPIINGSLFPHHIK